MERNEWTLQVLLEKPNSGLKRKGGEEAAEVRGFKQTVRDTSYTNICSMPGYS